MLLSGNGGLRRKLSVETPNDPMASPNKLSRLTYFPPEDALVKEVSFRSSLLKSWSLLYGDETKKSSAFDSSKSSVFSSKTEESDSSGEAGEYAVSSPISIRRRCANSRAHPAQHESNRE